MKIFKKLQYIILFFSILFISCESDNKNFEQPEVTNDTIQDSGQIEKLNEQIKNDSGNPELYFERAKLYVSLKKYQEALNDIEICLSIDSTKSEY